MGDINAQLNTLCTDAINQQKSAETKASIYYYINVFISIISIISGTAIAALAFSSVSWKSEITATLGIIIATLKTISTTINLESKASTFKSLSVKLRQLVRRILQLESQDPKTINTALTEVYKTFDDIDLSIFNESNSLGRLVSASDDVSGIRSIPQGSPSTSPGYTLIDVVPTN